jgi:hypothetical protein
MEPFRFLLLRISAQTFSIFSESKMNGILGSMTTILMAIIGVAILAVLVSKNSNTTAVLQAGSSAFSGSLGTALSPITGSSLGGSSFGNSLVGV